MQYYLADSHQSMRCHVCPLLMLYLQWIKKKYNILMIGITKDGRWLLVDSTDKIADDTWRDSRVQAILSPDASDHGIFMSGWRGCAEHPCGCDLSCASRHVWRGRYRPGAFLNWHVSPTWDAAWLASAVSMDKVYTKIIVDTLGIRQARYVVIRHTDLNDMDDCVKRVGGDLVLIRYL